MINFIFPVGVLQQSESDQIDDESLPEDFQPRSEDIIKYATKKNIITSYYRFVECDY